jgi:hypothetical protein
MTWRNRIEGNFVLTDIGNNRHARPNLIIKGLRLPSHLSSKTLRKCLSCHTVVRTTKRRSHIHTARAILNI